MAPPRRRSGREPLQKGLTMAGGGGDAAAGPRVVRSVMRQRRPLLPAAAPPAPPEPPATPAARVARRTGKGAAGVESGSTPRDRRDRRDRAADDATIHRGQAMGSRPGPSLDSPTRRCILGGTPPRLPSLRVGETGQVVGRVVRRSGSRRRRRRSETEQGEHPRVARHRQHVHAAVRQQTCHHWRSCPVLRGNASRLVSRRAHRGHREGPRGGPRERWRSVPNNAPPLAPRAPPLPLSCSSLGMRWDRRGR